MILISAARRTTMAELMDKALDAGIAVLATPCILLCVQMKAFIDHNGFPRDDMKETQRCWIYSVKK